MKKISVLLSIAVILILLISCDGSIFSGSGSTLSSVRDWANYKSFGIGSIGISNRTTTSDSGFNLVGFKEDGSIEVLAYDDESGNRVKKTLYVVAFVDYDRFAFVVFSQDPQSTVLTNEDLHYIVALGGEYFGNADTYLIDKHTGNLYLLDDRVGTFQVTEGNAWEITENFYAMDYTAYTGTVGLKKFKIDSNDQLVIETLPGWEKYSDIMMDRFQNTYYKYNEVSYILTNNGQLNTVPIDGGKGLHLGLNGIMYYGNSTGMDPSEETIQAYNELGNLTISSFVPQGLGITDLLFNKKPLVRTTLDSIYWNSGVIYCVHFLDTSKMQYELRSFTVSTQENVALCGNYLVWLDNANIQTLNLDTDVVGEITMVNGSNSVFIEELLSGGDGKVYFYGQDQQRNQIEGLLTPELDYSFISTPYTQSKNSIIYISPIL
jgi:hypothetical protein